MLTPSAKRPNNIHQFTADRALGPFFRNRRASMTDRRFVDLHTHSTASDGTLSPTEVVALADAANLAVFALTDHDTTSGLAEARAAAAARPGLRFVPGVEVSARYSPGMMHILGLGIDETSEALRKLLAGFIDARDQRNPKILNKLHDLGIDVGMEDVLAAAESFEPGRAHVIGRMHIAEAMRVKGHAASIRDAFTRYLSNGGIAYVDKERLEPQEVIQGI
ncbi:MAG: PHP domain-containing protein, partial [Syntrophobacterales bacterium]